MAGIALAVIGIVDLARPFVRTRGAHPHKQRKANDPALCQGGIGILVVDLKLARARIDRVFQPDNDAANAPAAIADADLCIARLGQPDPAYLCPGLRLTREGGQRYSQKSNEQTNPASHPVPQKAGLHSSKFSMCNVIS